MSFIKLTKNKGVSEVRLNRPEIHNAFNDVLIDELKAIFVELEKDDTTRVVVLTGEGKSFCAGADLKWMKSMANYSLEENIKDSNNLESLFHALNNFSKPLIGRINGSALGGGVGLLSVCDYVIAAKEAKFGFTEVRLGLVPAVISPYVINKIGETYARAYFLSGNRFGTHQAFHMGLVHEVVALEELDNRMESLVASFLKAAPTATQKAKKLVKTILNLNSEDEIQKYTCDEIAKLRVSSEGQEGMGALLEKRTPNWLGND